jgi:uncharacterized protein YuzE
VRHGTSRAPRLPRRGHALVLSVLTLGGLSLAGAGCASPSTHLTVTSLEKRQTYRQGFSRAYSHRNAQGDVEVVAACGTPTASGALHPDLKQVMHIRVLWSPGPGLKTDQPAATNAAITWYVFTNGHRMDMVEYTGTGLVEVDRDGDTTTVEIRNASLRPALTSGALRDPIGPSRFEGTVVARTDKRKVEEILSGVKATLATARLRQVRADAGGQ